MKVEIHTTFVHDCSDWDSSKFDAHNRFVAGEVVEVPDNMGDYFIRAGWASEVGGHRKRSTHETHLRRSRQLKTWE